jgi:hypothetical protein
MILNTNMNLVNKGEKRMAKSKKKKADRTRETAKSRKGQTKAAEYVSCLWELHKLQKVLLTQLSKEVR